MDIVLWGVRGSIAGPSKDTTFYGSNTPCVELRTNDGTLIIFDAGSGLRLLGKTLPQAGECHLFISHGHLDHIQGLGFFPPLNNPAWTTHIYVPAWLAHIPDSFFDGNMFPVPFYALKGKIVHHLLHPNKTVEIPTQNASVLVEHFSTNHPGGNLAYKVHANNAVFLYSGDHEITNAPEVLDKTQTMLAGVDLAVVDAAYSRNDYRPGWGHSAWEDWVALAQKMGTGCLVLSHHSPDKTDKELDALQRSLLQDKTLNVQVLVAREGMRFTPPNIAKFTPKSSDWLHEFIDDLARYKDEYVLLDLILAKSREITQADAGTVFLVEGDELVFAYTHNDTLFSTDNAHKYAYSDVRLPIASNSIAGYVAVTGKILNIPNVYALSPEVPYHFNGSFDQKTGYHTHSMLNVPLFDRNKKILGVIQLINCLGPKGAQAFTKSAEQSLRLLAREAAGILEISGLMRQNIYRLLRAASVHDPAETGPHAERVGAMAAELYQCWAKKTAKNPDEIRSFKSELRLAAMLHDIGKVGISDLVLKKPGKLDDAEFGIMRTHTNLGAELLSAESNDITNLAHDIALHHHQKWNGTGYVGNNPQARLAGENIPLAARITALADVFDALVSPRCYKNAWSFDDACDLVRRESGSHFDPLLVECFLEIFDTIHMIYARFPEHHNICSKEIES